MVQFSRRWKKYTEVSWWQILGYVLRGAKNVAGQSSTFTRMAVLEARADKKALKKILAFFPFIMFLVFGVVLGKSFIRL